MTFQGTELVSSVEKLRSTDVARFKQVEQPSCAERKVCQLLLELHNLGSGILCRAVPLQALDIFKDVFILKNTSQVVAHGRLEVNPSKRVQCAAAGLVIPSAYVISPTPGTFFAHRAAAVTTLQQAGKESSRTKRSRFLYLPCT